MSRPLPVGNIKWLSPNDIAEMMQDHSKISACTLEVDMEHPEELHDLHN